MNKFLNLTKLFSLILVVSLFASCSKDDNYVKIIPSDASMVVSFNAKSINEKSNVEDITQTELYKNAIEQADQSEVAKIEEYTSLVQSSEENGIDVNKTFYMFFQGSLESNPTFGITLPLNDKAKFKSILEEKLKQEKVEYSIVSKNKVEYIELKSNNEAFIAWNDIQLLIYTSSNNDYETTVNKGIELFSNSKETSVISNDNFNEFLNNTKDISAWFNYKEFMSLMQPQQMLVYSQLPFDLKGSYAEMHMSFNKGDISLDIIGHPNKEMKAMMEKYDLFSNKFNTDITEFISANNYLNIGMSVNFEAYYEWILEILSESQGENIDKFIAEFESQTDMKVEDLLDALGGSIYAGVYDIEMNEVETTDWNAFMESDKENKKIEDFKMMKEVPVPLFAVATDVTDEKVFDLVKKFGQSSLQQEGDYLVIPNNEMNIYLNWNEEILLLTNDNSLIVDFSNGKKADNKLSKTDIGKAIADNNVYIQLNPNTNSYPEGLQNMIRDNVGGSTIIGDFTSAFTNIELINNDKFSQHLIITMKDDSKNSLEVLINTINSNVDNLQEISEK